MNNDYTYIDHRTELEIASLKLIKVTDHYTNHASKKNKNTICVTLINKTNDLDLKINDFVTSNTIDFKTYDACKKILRHLERLWLIALELKMFNRKFGKEILSDAEATRKHSVVYNHLQNVSKNLDKFRYELQNSVKRL